MQDKDNFNEFINELIDKNDILEVVRGYVDLTRKGNSYWGRCPFHHEKTASFHVEERLKIYKCFGCGAAGNVIKFVQEIESVSFMEAVKILADRVGMKVPEFHKRKDVDIEEKKRKQERHYEIVSYAAKYYHGQLMRNPKIIEFMRAHGIDKGTITAYGLGYSPSLFGIGSHLIGLGYNDKEIEEAGVCYTTEDDKFHDVMAGRIICPHINTFGKVSGFAGSTRNGDTIYTKNTDIFRRDSEVFGTHLLKSIKVEEGIDHLIVTSTPINAVALRGKGNRKVVSVMGDSIGARQARALMRFTDKFTAVFSDTARGIDKEYDGLDTLVAEGGSIKVATLCEHVNVLDTIEHRTYDRLMTWIKRAKSLLEYQLRRVSQKYDLDTEEGKFDFLDIAKGYIMAIKERSKQEPYISVLANIVSLSEDTIRKSFYEDKDKSHGGVKRVSKKKGKDYQAMMSLLALDSVGYDVGDISAYLDGEYLDYYLKRRAGESVELATYFTDEEASIIKAASIDDKSNDKVFRDCLKIVKDAHLKKKQNEIIAKIEGEQDLDKKRLLLEELNSLMKG